MSQSEQPIWTISIDDGYVEYSYEMRGHGDQCIHSLRAKIEKALRRKLTNETMRTDPVVRRATRRLQEAHAATK